MIKTRFLWAYAGRYSLYGQKRELIRFGVLLFPRPDHTPEGSLVAGWSLFFRMDWIDFDLVLARIRYP